MIAQTERQDGSNGEKYAVLEERVRVLERIVTDKQARLKDEIDAL